MAVSAAGRTPAQQRRQYQERETPSMSLNSLQSRPAPYTQLMTATSSRARPSTSKVTLLSASCRSACPPGVTKTRPVVRPARQTAAVSLVLPIPGQQSLTTFTTQPTSPVAEPSPSVINIRKNKTENN